VGNEAIPIREKAILKSSSCSRHASEILDPDGDVHIDRERRSRGLFDLHLNILRIFNNLKAEFSEGVRKSVV
jgi:hypothetical protein